MAPPTTPTTGIMPRTLSWHKGKDEDGSDENKGSDSANGALDENHPHHQHYDPAGRLPTPSSSTVQPHAAAKDPTSIKAGSPSNDNNGGSKVSTAQDAPSGGSTPIGTPDPSPRAASFHIHHHHQPVLSSPDRDSSPSPPRLDWSRTSQASGTGSSIGSTGSGSIDSKRSEADQQAAARSALLRAKLADVNRKVSTATLLASPTGSSSGSHDGFRANNGNSLNGGSAAAKKAMQMVKDTIMFAGKRQMLLPKAERDLLVQKWGIDKVDKVEEEALSLFSSLDGSQAAADGQLQLAEFQLCLGAMGGSCVSSEFPEVLFSAIDKDRNGTISFSEFLNWLLTITHGSNEEKLRYGFDLCDQNKDGTIDKRDLTTTIENMFKVLTGLNLPSHDICIRRFVDTVFTRLAQHALQPQEEGGGISWEAFKAGSKSIETFLRTLGSRDVSCYHTPCSRSRNKAATVVFGSPKWKFITNMVSNKAGVCFGGLEWVGLGWDERTTRALTAPNCAAAGATATNIHNAHSLALCFSKIRRCLALSLPSGARKSRRSTS